MVHYSNDLKVKIIHKLYNVYILYLGYFVLITGHPYEIRTPCI